MKRPFLSLMVLSLLGLLASILLTRLHYRIGEKGFEEKSFCNVSETFDCDAALASRFSNLRISRLGVVPTSELGILYYLLLSGGLLYAWISQKIPKGTLAFFFTASLFAFVYSLVMAYLSIFKLGVLCLLCLTTYLVNLLVLVLFPRLLGVPYRGVPGFLTGYVRSFFFKGTDRMPGIAFHLVITLLVTGIGLLFFRGLNPQIHRAHAEVPREAYLKAFYAAPQKPIDLPERPFWGNREGQVTVVEFSDFQCPFCRRAAFTLKPYLKEFRDEVRLVFVNYPLDNSCNPAIPHAMHPTACLAAKAALCAFREGKFWDYHDQVFENQKRLSRSALLRIAGEVGLDRAGFEQCLVSDETADRLKEDVESGSRLEVRGTPALFINGRPFPDWLRPELLRMVIEAEIRRVNKIR